jgi:uncharacterized protein (DUF885 family)
MRKTALALTVAVLLSLGPGLLLAQSGEDAKFKKFQETFFDAYFKFFPTQGSLQGYSKYNEKLEDLSGGAVEKFHDGLDNFNQEIVTKIDKTKLSPEFQLEHEMMMDFLDLEFVRFENLVPWEYNPLFYNDIILNGMRGLFAGPYSAADAVRCATERAKALPAFLKKARENLKTPPEEYTRAAVEQMPGIVDFYRNELPRLAGSSSLLQAELNKALPALEEYGRFLQSELLPRSTGNFRLGESHLRILRRRSQGVIPIVEEMGPRSTADYKNIRREMSLVSIPFFNIMYPEVNIDQLYQQKGEEATRQMLIQNVLEKINQEHCSRDQFLARVQAAAEKMRSFVQETKLAPLPAETLKIEAMPAYVAPGWLFQLVGPGAYAQTAAYTLYVRTIPSAWNEEKAVSFLREYNDHFIDLAVAKDVMPGSFAPAALSWKNASLVRRLCANQALIKGWPLYLLDKYIYAPAGLNRYDLKTRLNELKLQLKNAIMFQMDMNIHEGTYTKEKAISYMTSGGFISDAEAERIWTYLVLNPGDAALAYIGYQELLDLEKEYRKMKGANFTTADFLQKVLSHGPIPLRALKAKLAS